MIQRETNLEILNNPLNFCLGLKSSKKYTADY